MIREFYFWLFVMQMIIAPVMTACALTLLFVATGPLVYLLSGWVLWCVAKDTPANIKEFVSRLRNERAVAKILREQDARGYKQPIISDAEKQSPCS